MAESSIGEILKGKGKLPKGTKIPEPKEDEIKITRKPRKRLGIGRRKVVRRHPPKTPDLRVATLKYLAEPAKKEKRKEILPPQGTIGFVKLANRHGLNTGSFIEALPQEADKLWVYITVPENDELMLLTDSGKETGKISSESNRIQHLDARYRAIKSLNELLKQNGWQEVTAVSESTPVEFPKALFFGSIWIIPHEDKWLELPPGIYPIDLPTKIKSGEEPIPAEAKDIRGNQKKYNVQFFPITMNSQNPGLRWVNNVGGPHYFACFYERRPDLESEGWWEYESGGRMWRGEWIFGEWVVRKTPEAVDQYLKERFDARLDLEQRKIHAPEDRIGQIIGMVDGRGKKHIDYLQDILDRAKKGKKLVVKRLPTKGVKRGQTK